MSFCTVLYTSVKAICFHFSASTEQIHDIWNGVINAINEPCSDSLLFNLELGKEVRSAIGATSVEPVRQLAVSKEQKQNPRAPSYTHGPYCTHIYHATTPSSQGSQKKPHSRGVNRCNRAGLGVGRGTSWLEETKTDLWNHARRTSFSWVGMAVYEWLSLSNYYHLCTDR